MRDQGQKMARAIKENLKVGRQDIRLTCMMVLIDVAEHEIHITQQGRGLCLVLKAEKAIRGSMTVVVL